MKIEDVIEKFNTTPFLFLGSGVTRRYYNLPDWRGLLKHFAYEIKTDDFIYSAYENKASKEENPEGLLPKVAEMIQIDYDEKWFRDPSIRTLNDDMSNETNNNYEQLQGAISDSMILDIIMTHSQDTIYFKDKDSRYIANSTAHVIQVGLKSANEMRGKCDFDFFPEEFAKIAYQDELNIMETGIPILGKQEKLTWSDGSCVWFSASDVLMIKSFSSRTILTTQIFTSFIISSPVI